jgi:tetratricopeptide (TPR) repeat protein/glycosyltransferase involved in cell wall biosynthesis
VNAVHPASSRDAIDRARPPLRIVAVGPREPLDRGPGLYRTIQPCRALGELGDVTVVSGSTLSVGLGLPAADGEPDWLADADILVLRDVADPDLLPVLAARRRLGRPTVFEVGADYRCAPCRRAPRRNSDLLERSMLPQLARQSDAVQFPTPALAHELRSLSPRRAVFPSQQWQPPSLAPLRPMNRTVIGWVGTSAEAEDLRLAIPALTGILDRHPDARVAIMGDPTLGELLAALPADRVSLVEGGPGEATEQFLETLDIGLAPLIPTPFNRTTGDVRFIEYAAHGVLAICADLEPFRDCVRPGQTGFLFRDPGELETVLERAIAEPEARGAITARAARSVAERIERRHAPARLGFYLRVAAEVSGRLGYGRSSAAFPPNERLADFQAGRTFAGSHYLALGAGEVETLLGDAAALAEADDVAGARRALAQAEALAPRSHLPPLLLGSIETGASALDALARAEARNPRSCLTAHLRGEHLLDAGDTEAAAAAFERARAIAPAFGAPHERLGAIAEAAGRITDACRLYEEAALHDSALAQPIARLASLARREGRVDKAVALLERSLADDPSLSLTNLLLGRIYLDMKRFHEARVHLERALDGADDPGAVHTEIGRAEAGLGNAEAARLALTAAWRA